MFELMLIDNNPESACMWEAAGVDIIFIDLETKGKLRRQGHLDTVISRHSYSDINSVKAKLTRSKLLVRINPLHSSSLDEVEEVIDRGADIIMLPMFSSVEDLAEFAEIVKGRVASYPLVETPSALSDFRRLSDWALCNHVEGYHIGLNDLHLAKGLSFMFEAMLDTDFKKAVCSFKQKGIRFGVGGVGRVGSGILPAEVILKEYYRLGCCRTILSRSFKEEVFSCDITREVMRIKAVYENSATSDLNANQKLFNTLVRNISKTQ